MIWLIGGTINAREICQLLVSSGMPVIVTVTTEYGRKLSELPGITVITGNLNIEQMCVFINNHKIDTVIDASHPFAIEVSINAIQAAHLLNIIYLRFERNNVFFEKATYVKDYQEAIVQLRNTSGNILLTTGSKHIKQYISLGIERLYARVLSTSESLTLCEDAGLKTSHILGLSGVGSVALNLALLREFNINHMVTKDSGKEGGLEEKLEAARQADVNVFVIKRPTITYPEIYTDIQLLVYKINNIYKQCNKV